MLNTLHHMLVMHKVIHKLSTCYQHILPSYPHSLPHFLPIFNPFLAKLSTLLLLLFFFIFINI